MARIIGGVATTHVPSIGKAIAEHRENEPYWRPFFGGFDFVHGWLKLHRPDVVVVFSNDHGLNFFLDKIPTFAVGAAAEYRNEDEGWGIPVSHASHHLDGERAGFINKDFDKLCMDSVVKNPDALSAYSIPHLVKEAGAQG